jgi:hypothetical protein
MRLSATHGRRRTDEHQQFTGAAIWGLPHQDAPVDTDKVKAVLDRPE